MRYLLDSRVFLWWCSKSSKLSPRVFDIIKNGESSVYISLLSIREIQIKSQVGKVDLPVPIMDIFSRQNAEHNIQMLAIELHHMKAMIDLPNHHIDPFDRILIAQAIAENMTLITTDENIAKYPVQVLW
jgi:PIN domain nuclease of toxin-antitoxin system